MIIIKYPLVTYFQFCIMSSCEESLVDTPADFRALNQFKPILNHFKQSLGDANFYQERSMYTERATGAFRSAPVTNMELQLGRLIFSAMINGALLRQEWLSALLESIANKIIIIEEDQTEKYLIWVELAHSVSSDQNEAKLRRRWFPDPVSAMLLVKLLSTKGSMPVDGTSGKQPVSYYLNRFFASLGIPTRNRPTLTECLSVASTRINFRLPGFLVKYAESINHAQSLSPEAWGRLLYDKVLATTGEEKNTQSEYPAPAKIEQKNSESHLPPSGCYPDQLKKLRELQSFFSRYHHKKAPRLAEVSKSIENFLTEKEEISPMLQALGQWSLAMMRTKRFSRKKLKPTAMRDYLYAIGKPLLLNGAELDIISLSLGDWENIYDHVLEMSSSPQRRKFKGDRLREFHAYLQLSFNTPPVSIEDIAGGLRTVNANIITPREYLAIRNNLKNGPHHTPRLRTILSLLFTLGFRCGLRRNEALTIELDDLQLQGSTDGKSYVQGPELFIGRSTSF